MKYCPNCNKELSDNSFYKSSTNKDGLAIYCRDCDRERNKKYRESHPDYAKEYRSRNIEKARARGRDVLMKRKYGIDYSEFIAMSNKQNNKCAICGNDLDMGKLTHVDHDHKTGKVRGILCRNCNHGLGNFMDDISLMAKAIDYLRKF